jgi:hypothetical protein
MKLFLPIFLSLVVALGAGCENKPPKPKVIAGAAHG